MYEYNFLLTRVIDGDSIEGDIDLGFGVWLRDVHVRLNGVDAPEKSRVRLSQDMIDEGIQDQLKIYGQYVTAWLSTQLMGQILTIKTEYHSQKDKYGRVLGNIVARDPYTSQLTDINQFMVDSRLAVAYNGNSSRALNTEQHISNMDFCYDQGYFTYDTDRL